MANTVPIAKKYREVKISDRTHWERTANADGSVTYTSKDPTAGVTFVKEDNGDQHHDNVPNGRKFTIKDGHADLWDL